MSNLIINYKNEILKAIDTILAAKKVFDKQSNNNEDLQRKIKAIAENEKILTRIKELSNEVIKAPLLTRPLTYKEWVKVLRLIPIEEWAS